MKAKAAIQTILFLFPWAIRRRFLNALFKFEIAPTARIGLSLVLIEKLTMKEYARIGHLNTIKSFDFLLMQKYSKIGNSNYITGISSKSGKHFLSEQARKPELHLGEHSSITGRHFIDCCNRIEIGNFSIIAGAGSQILSHAIDFFENTQKSAPVRIGHHCFVGTASVVLRGAQLPDCSILSANSTLSKFYTQDYQIYSGVPAQPVKEIDKSSKYFLRTDGFVA